MYRIDTWKQSLSSEKPHHRFNQRGCFWLRKTANDQTVGLLRWQCTIPGRTCFHFSLTPNDDEPVHLHLGLILFTLYLSCDTKWLRFIAQRLTPHHVGSSLMHKHHRDVDVRLILSDETYALWELGNPEYPLLNAKWISLCRAYSALGTAMTNLPIDFQIQQRTFANTHYGKQERSALGILPIYTAMETEL